ncbi:MAG: glycosyltransferase family 4 protein [Pseudomonadota bacterium]
MRIAFYAPMKAPDHPVPSGDRAMARLLVRALEQAGGTVTLASRFRSWQAAADAERQTRLADLGAALARRFLRRCAAEPALRPEVWVTYHLYYKAPDFIGPAVASALDIPYLLVEASLADKRAGGPWDRGHQACVTAVETAARVLQINPEDAECLPAETRQELLPPFLDAAPYTAALQQRAESRARLAKQEGLEPVVPWLVSVAMMRSGDKLASYRRLAAALALLTDRAWQLVIIGDGEARTEVEAAFRASLGAEAERRLRYLGQVPEGAVAEPLAACDLFVWPAVNEAYGMAPLEAQAAGVPVVAGWRPGLTTLVSPGKTGLLIEDERPEAFAQTIASLLDRRAARDAMSRAASTGVAERHSLPAAAAQLRQVLAELT